MKNSYCLGFMFNNYLTDVALIEKIKPSWQKGKLNGIGGKIENGETPLQAMQREFKEETGITQEKWTEFCKMEGLQDEGQFEVFCFYCASDSIWDLKTVTEEKIRFVYIENLKNYKLMENLTWLIHMSLDGLKDGNPKYSIVKY